MGKYSLIVAVLLLGSVPARAQSILHQFDSAFAGFGWSVANAGDVDRDGHDDVIVGNFVVGSAQVFSGKDGSELYGFATTNPYWVFGYSVDGVGDVNGDGFDDVVVGAADLCCAGVAGGAFVFSGKDASTLYSYSGAVNEGFGYCVAGVGDVNQDGRPDFAVSAYSNSEHGMYVGKVLVYSGKTGGLLWSFYGDNTMDFFGAWMSGAGDVNKDGASDIIVGKYNFPGGVRVLSGKTGGILYDYQGTSSAPIGFGVGGVGDINLDGFADFMFLASDHIEVRSGKTGAVLLSPSEPDIGSTTSLHGTGDVDQDGHPDIIAGNWYSDEGVGGGGHATVFSGKDGAELCRIAGLANGEFIGQAVGGGGDVNGDGVSDFLISHYGTRQVEAYRWLPSGNYGRGWPGTNGIPKLALGGAPELCTWVPITIGNSPGAATAGFTLYGLADADLPTQFDGHMLVLPSRVIGLPIPTTGLTLQLPVPCDPAYTGFTIFLQVIEADANASKGYSFSPGLKIVMGKR